jgi:hypothetical protein
LAANRIGDERRQPLVLLIGKLILDADIAALKQTGLVQAAPERTDEVPGASGVSASQEPDHRQRLLLLGGHDRPRCRAAQKCNELSPPQVEHAP